MAVNREFQARFATWLKQRGLSGMAASYETNLSVSTATINNWKRGMEPSEDTLRKFFSYFPEENVEDWVGMLGSRDVA